MGKVVRNLIEYSGISTHTYCNSNFRQSHIDKLSHVKDKRADIDQITKVWINASVIDTEIIKTPVGRSKEGHVATGKKLIVCGDLNIKIEYISCDVAQSVYVENVAIPFGTYVALPNDFNEHGIVSATILVEDISSLKINSHSIYNNITLLTIADIY